MLETTAHKPLSDQPEAVVSGEAAPLFVVATPTTPKRPKKNVVPVNPLTLTDAARVASATPVPAPELTATPVADTGTSAPPPIPETAAPTADTKAPAPTATPEPVSESAQPAAAASDAQAEPTAEPSAPAPAESFHLPESDASAPAGVPEWMQGERAAEVVEHIEPPILVEVAFQPMEFPRVDAAKPTDDQVSDVLHFYYQNSTAIRGPSTSLVGREVARLERLREVYATRRGRWEGLHKAYARRLGGLQESQAVENATREQRQAEQTYTQAEGLRTQVLTQNYKPEEIAEFENIYQLERYVQRFNTIRDPAERAHLEKLITSLAEVVDLDHLDLPALQKEVESMNKAGRYAGYRVFRTFETGGDISLAKGEPLRVESRQALKEKRQTAETVLKKSLRRERASAEAMKRLGKKTPEERALGQHFERIELLTDYMNPTDGTGFAPTLEQVGNEYGEIRDCRYKITAISSQIDSVHGTNKQRDLSLEVPQSWVRTMGDLEKELAEHAETLSTMTRPEARLNRNQKLLKAFARGVELLNQPNVDVASLSPEDQFQLAVLQTLLGRLPSEGGLRAQMLAAPIGDAEIRPPTPIVIPTTDTIAPPTEGADFTPSGADVAAWEAKAREAHAREVQAAVPEASAPPPPAPEMEVVPATTPVEMTELPSTATAVGTLVTPTGEPVRETSASEAPAAPASWTQESLAAIAINDIPQTLALLPLEEHTRFLRDILRQRPDDVIPLLVNGTIPPEEVVAATGLSVPENFPNDERVALQQRVINTIRNKILKTTDASPQHIRDLILESLSEMRTSNNVNPQWIYRTMSETTFATLKTIPTIQGLTPEQITSYSNLYRGLLTGMALAGLTPQS